MEEKEKLRIHEALKDIPTCDLVKELEQREGVLNTIMVPNEAKIKMTVEGPSVVLVVID